MAIDETTLEQEMIDKGLVAPRLTPALVDAQIVGEQYHRFPGSTMTICALTLRNGFQVIGESASASPENFDEAIGKKIARDKARSKIWALEGYLLKAKLDKHVASIVAIARVAHEINRAYCESIGDFSIRAWDAAPDWQKESSIAGVKFLKDNPDATPADTHASWLAHKTKAGWKYGSVKSDAEKLHPCCLPYAELPLAQKTKDYLFQAAVRALI